MWKSLEGEFIQLRAEVLMGLAEPKRLLILHALTSGPKPASELAVELELDPLLVQRHLRVMHRAGLVLASLLRGEIHYQISDDRVLEALGLLRAFLRDSLYRRAVMAGVLATN